jgi:CheY-like chemotaxis protein
MPEPSSQPHKPVVLCVDDDRDIAEVVEAILVDGGYDVSCLYTLDDDALRRTVGRLEPDCVLLDGLPGPEYGSWESAAWLEHRARSVPVVMFTAHQPDSREAQEAHTDRAKRADFAAVLLKPFNVDELLDAVATAVGRSQLFGRGVAAEQVRTTALVNALQARGATDIRPSKARESASFRDAGGHLWHINWWQLRGVYQLGRYDDNRAMAMAGQFSELEAAIEIALPR